MARLDVMPATVAKFRRNGDSETADLLEHIIYKVGASSGTMSSDGLRWLSNMDWWQVSRGSLARCWAGLQPESVTNTAPGMLVHEGSLIFSGF